MDEAAITDARSGESMSVSDGIVAGPCLAIAGVSKTFGGQPALDEVDLQLRRGEVHALLGKNGSGKSTLIKILAGYHTPESGSTATVDGEPFELGSPSAAHAAGLRFIHQDLAVIDTMSVVDNLALGESFAGRWWLSDRRERAAAQKVFTSYGVDVDVSRSISELGAAQRAMTAIVRALHHGDAARGVLVLDEPTAALPEHEKRVLFDLIRRVRGAGGTILYVTHFLKEVFELADRVTVLRDGRRITTQPVAELDHDRLVGLIVGRELAAAEVRRDHGRGGEEALRVSDLSGAAVKSFDVDVRVGEIVSVVGLAGSGVEDVLPLVFGALPRATGEVRAGSELVAAEPRAAIRAGLAFAPADRRRLGGIRAWTVRENLTLPRIEAKRRTGWLGAGGERRSTARYLEALDVAPRDPEARFDTLSGGNQQKVVLAKWLRCGASTLLLQEPTAGVDVGAKAAIYDALRTAVADGGAVLITTSDYEEACVVSDRILVIGSGRITTELAGADCTEDIVLAEVLRAAPSERSESV